MTATVTRSDNDGFNFERAIRVHGLTRRQAGAFIRMAKRTGYQPYTGDKGPSGGLGLLSLPRVLTVEQCENGRWVQTRILQCAHDPELDRYNTDDLPRRRELGGYYPYRAVSGGSPDALAARGARTYASPLDALRAALRRLGH